ncbi:hypothetical protein BCR41DRAFT_376103 [Lobosporangium transversale]|uniref:Ubiquitin-like protease family profile domain-containing protein n=1 Tax=Lobosporangium transversale TaxID=64571 RepID=A0A1Y2G117_9FUNG|nr:hypothetical protein BCR41DRAFT_376103 [Lobosporangium transversale]ORY90323.1 hypothetical protein BCR41DRAFT_376103 [Lobosporangium transversale]|eukprot:XP_021875093.1 hypothetical protein BCR41DRAFT_376103 [Lobosporangium transversale]
MAYCFRPLPDIHLSVRSTLFLANECYIDDDLIRSVLEIFRVVYKDVKGGPYMFIPPLYLPIWRDADNSEEECYTWLGEELKNRPSKAFAVVQMSEHWGVLVVDFVQKSISFGDSLKKFIPVEILNGIQRWMTRNGINFQAEKWGKRVQYNLNVPRQPLGSGSCGIIALNTIERILNPKVERWSHERSCYHRTRLLRLVTGQTTLQPGAIEAVSPPLPPVSTKESRPVPGSTKVPQTSSPRLARTQTPVLINPLELGTPEGSTSVSDIDVDFQLDPLLDDDATARHFSRRSCNIY